MNEPRPHDNGNPVQVRRLLLCLLIALSAVALLTPLLTALGTGPRKTSVSILRFAFLIAVMISSRQGKSGLLRESGLATAGHPARIWIRAFVAGAVPLILYVAGLTIGGERVWEGIEDPGRFWWAVIKYLPLSLIIGFLEDMLFFGFLAALFGLRLAPCVLIYAVTHFLAPDRDHVWANTNWMTGLEALIEMGRSLAGAIDRPVELFGLVLVGAVLASLRARTGSIWASMGVHGGWYYVRTISRKLGEDLEGHREWLYGSDRFYDGLLGWLAILTTGLLFRFTWKVPTRAEEPTEE